MRVVPEDQVGTRPKRCLRHGVLIIRDDARHEMDPQCNDSTTVSACSFAARTSATKSARSCSFGVVITRGGTPD